MLEEVRRLMSQVPFQPFTIRLTSGQMVAVPHSDHIMVTSKGLVAVEDDAGYIEFFSTLHMSSVRLQGASV